MSIGRLYVYFSQEKIKKKLINSKHFHFFTFSVGVSKITLNRNLEKLGSWATRLTQPALPYSGGNL